MLLAFQRINSLTNVIKNSTLCFQLEVEKKHFPKSFILLAVHFNGWLNLCIFIQFKK